MEAWQEAPLTDSQRPVLLSGEIEHLLVPAVSIRTLKAKTGHEKGQLYLTTHRVIWLEAVTSSSVLLFRGKRKAISLHHAHVRAVDSHSKGGAVRSAKLKVDLAVPGGQSSSLLVAVHSHGAADTLCHKWRELLAQRAWVPATPPPSSSSSSSSSSVSSSSSSTARPINFSTSSAGVSGLIRVRDEQARATDAALAEAFTDLNALMSKAKDLVGLAERFRVEASKQHEGGDGVTEEESNVFNSYLLSLGIATPVTKQSAGALFHSELARQLCDFLAQPLQHAGGNMSLADVYCLFNRARGTELISPEDLYRACVLLEPLGLPLRLRKFDSGVMVIQPAGQTDAEIAGKVAKAVSAAGPMTAVDLASLWSISLPLAKEHLMTAEQAEFLCRDESFEGLVFYPNIFAT